MSFDEYLKMSLQLDLGLIEQTIGDYKLESCVYPKGTQLAVIQDNYQSFLMGDERKEIILENDFKYYDLFKGSQRIMSSSPAIMYEQYLPYLRAHGRVLLGGLGLGIIPRLLCGKENVAQVVVVELSDEVIKLCGFASEKVKILHDDIYGLIKSDNLIQYDYLYIDAYTTDCNAYQNVILPTKKFLIEHYPALSFDFWQEDQLKFEYLQSCRRIF